MADKPRHEYAYTDNDDWANVQDRRERKKIQNRLSQRKRRQKVRAENAAANNVGNERGSSTSSQGAGSQQVALDSFTRDSRSPLATYDLTYSQSQIGLDRYQPRLAGRGTVSTGNIEEWPSICDPNTTALGVPPASPPYLTYSHSAPTLMAETSVVPPATHFTNPFPSLMESSSVTPQYLHSGYPAQDTSYASEASGVPRYDRVSYRSSVDTAASSFIGSAQISPQIMAEPSMSLAQANHQNILDPNNLSRRGSQISPFDTQTVPMGHAEAQYSSTGLTSAAPRQPLYLSEMPAAYTSQQQPLTYNSSTTPVPGDYGSAGILPGPSIGSYLGQSTNMARSPSGGRRVSHSSRINPY